MRTANTAWTGGSLVAVLLLALLRPGLRPIDDRTRARTGRHARQLANAEQPGADQPGPCRAAAEWPGAHGRRLGQCGDGDELSGRRLGSGDRDVRDASPRLGHVLQRHGGRCTTAASSSTAAISSTTRFFGQPRNAVFDPATGLFTDIENMAHGRWYPTVTTLGDGRVMTFSGLIETGGTNTRSKSIPWVRDGASSTRPAGRRHSTRACT